MSIWTIEQWEFNWVSKLTCLTWGMSDGTINTHILQILGYEFSTSIDSFGLFNIVQGIIVSILLLIQAYSLSDLYTSTNIQSDIPKY